MFKKVINTCPVLAIALVIACCSCDSRKSKNDLFQESVTQFKDSLGPIEIVKYIPERNRIKEIDTILNTGFRFKIWSSLDMENAILKEVAKDTFIEKQYHRKSIVKLQVFLKDKLIFDEKIDSTFIKNHEAFMNTTDRDELIISDLWLDPKSHLNSNGSKIYFRIRAFNPNQKFDTRVHLQIDKNGKYYLSPSKRYAI